MRQVSRFAFIILSFLLIFNVYSIAQADDSSSLELKTRSGDYTTYYIVQNTGDNEIKITSAKVNRGNINISDYLREDNLPITLKFGEEFELFRLPTTEADSVLEVQISTDKGDALFKFNEN